MLGQGTRRGRRTPRSMQSAEQEDEGEDGPTKEEETKCVVEALFGFFIRRCDLKSTRSQADRERDPEATIG